MDTSRKNLYIAIGITATIIFGLLAVLYKKWTAEWFGIPVFFYAIPASAALAWGLSRLEWWQNRPRSTSFNIVIVLAGGLILSTFLGIFFTEPTMTNIQMSKYDYTYDDTRVGYWYGNNLSYGNANADVNSDDIDIDIDDADGEGFAYLILILLAIAVILASAFIPHFWIFGGFLLVTALVMVAYREFDIQEQSYY